MDRILPHLTNRIGGLMAFGALLVIALVSFQFSAVSWPGMLILLLAAAYGSAVATGAPYTENLLDTAARFVRIFRDVRTPTPPPTVPPVSNLHTGVSGPPPPSDADRAADPTTPAAVLMNMAATRPDLRPAIAGNPATYPALVEWLAALNDPAVDVALAHRQS